MCKLNGRVNNRRVLRIAALSALAGLLLGGCGSNSQPQSGSSSTSQSPSAGSSTSPSQSGGGGGAAIAAQLQHWPKSAAEQLGSLIAEKANSGSYAVFDADNTTYHYDLEESLLPFMEMKGALTRKTMNPSLTLIPFKDDYGHQESLYSYYTRLCEIDD